MVPKGAPKLFQLPDSEIRFFVRQSGFSKSTYLESTCYGEFLDAKKIPDKFCPGSGFCLNRSFSDIFLNLSLMFIQNDQKLRFFMSWIFPGCRNPDLGALSSFTLNRSFLDIFLIFFFGLLWSSIACSGFFISLKIEKSLY